MSRGLLPQLSKLQVAPSQLIGSVAMANPGDAEAYPLWVVTGPGNNFVAKTPAGEVLQWTGTLADGETLTIDTQKGTCVDGAGVNRYAELAPAPRMWRIPPGTSSAQVELDGSTAASSVVVSWRPRRWMG